jgi:hypothetical protein
VMNWKYVENFNIFYQIPVYDWNALEKFIFSILFHLELELLRKRQIFSNKFQSQSELARKYNTFLINSSGYVELVIKWVLF